MYEVINNLRTRGAGKPVTLHELYVTTGIDLNRCPSVFASLKVNQKVSYNEQTGTLSYKVLQYFCAL